MKKHYVYKITNLNPTDSRKFYIGVRSCNGSPCDDNYWGSSKYLKEAINQEGKESFIKEILSEWETREKAIEEEIRLHGFFDVRNNPEFYNRSNQMAVGFTPSWDKLSEEEKLIFREKCRQRPPISDETRKKLSDSSPLKGKPVSEERRQIIINSNKTRLVTEETKKKMSEANKGKKRTEEQNTHMSKIKKGLVMSEHQKEAIRKSTAKRWRKFLVIDPSGNEFEIVGMNDFNVFAKEKNISANVLVEMAKKGIVPTSRSCCYGWICSFND